MDKKAYSELKNEQDTHWWFTARREIICAVIHQYIKELIKKRSSDIDILDAGCGMGVLLKRLSAYGRVYGMDAEMEAVEYCSDLLKMAGGVEPFCRGVCRMTFLLMKKHLMLSFWQTA